MSAAEEDRPAAAGKTRQALEGVRVIEIGSLIAGPFATRILGDFGAEIIKIEPPGEGDPLRRWRHMDGDTSLWWYIQSRNKKSVTINFRSEEGRDIIRCLARESDVVVENLRPGSLERHGLGWEDLSKENPRLVMVRVSGFGQDGPYSQRPGFGATGEAIGGLRYVTGDPDRPPARVGVSIGDSITALYAVIGALMALRHRDQSGEGQYVDIALYEAVFSMMESLVTEYAVSGYIRERSGGALPGIAPSNTYLCKDGKYIVIAGNSDPIFQRLAAAIGCPDLAEDPAYRHNDGRVRHAETLDAAIGAWTATLPLAEALAKMEEARVPASPIYNAADIMNDPHYHAREMLVKWPHKTEAALVLPGVVPKMSVTPGSIRWLGGALGKDTDAVLEKIGYDDEMRRKMRDQGVI